MSAECVCLNIESYDLPIVYRESFPVARKIYVCCECDGEIKPGEKYHLFKGLWKNGWNTFRTCLVCHRIREDFFPCGYIFGEIQEEIWDNFGFNYVTGEVAEEDD